MTRQPNNNFYKIVVILWITLSVASVILAAITWVDLAHKSETARKMVAIREDLDGILRAAVDAETAQRGFTITGDEDFLHPLALAESSFPPRFERLAGFVKENDQLLKTVMELRAQAELSFNYQRQVVGVRKSQGGDAAAAMVAQGEGRRSMDTLRAKVAQLHEMIAVMRGPEAATTQPGSPTDDGAGARARLFRASLTSLIAGVLGLGAGAIAFWLSRIMLGHQRRERELTEAKLEAERSSQEKSLFLANMSHEIRTPMNAILGFSELLESELRDPKHRQYLKSIRSSGASLLQLMNDILDMSKIEAGVMELRLEPTDPREVCDFLHTIFAEPAAKKSVKLDCKVAEDLPHALLMDRIRLRQILVNLVGNAVKFTDRGRIEVRVNWEKQQTSSHVTLLIEVEDTGVGIPQDKLESIFTAFVQAGAHVEKEKTGTGLGLSIVRRLTEMMGGTVVAASVMGQGSAFSLRFPNVAVSARLATADKRSDAPVNFNDLRPASVLVADDNETNCQLVAGLFAETDHRLTFAANGIEAVEKARALRPEIILLDLRMPGMDGRQALGEIRKIPGLELTPVIAVTASSLLHEESELKARFSGYVRKPFSKGELFEELAQFLPRRSQPDSPPRPAGAPPASFAPELQAELRRLFATEWPPILDSLAINESKAFGTKLKTLSQRWPCPPLESYADALIRYADNYLIVELEKHLFEFSTLVNRLAPAT